MKAATEMKKERNKDNGKILPLPNPFLALSCLRYFTQFGPGIFEHSLPRANLTFVKVQLADDFHGTGS